MQEIPTVVITTYNEVKNIDALIKSLLSQTMQCHIIVVDSESNDGTIDALKKFDTERVSFKIKKCTRGEGRNLGVEMSSSRLVLFTDGDAIPDRNWVECMSKCLNDADLVSGETVQKGIKRYASFKRVKLFYRNFEITSPSMNIGIRRDVFIKMGGFDPRFITAEDIDLNLRIISMDYKGIFCNSCKISHIARQDLRSFLKQAFWNGYGRGQLRSKNKTMWADIKKGKIDPREIGIYWLLRNLSAVLGYLSFLIFGKKDFNYCPPSEGH